MMPASCAQSMPGPDHPAQVPAARAALFMGIFAAFLVPFSEAESDHCITSISADHEEEHLHGPIDQTPDDRRFAAILLFRDFVIVLLGCGRARAGVSEFICGLEVLRPSVAQLPRDGAMEQSWYNPAARSLHCPASAPKHCSIDPSFSFARGARH